MSYMKKVLFVQTNLQPPGGASLVAAWMIEALKKDYSVSLLTWASPDFKEINRFYGTSLNGSELNVDYINPILRRLIGLDPDPGSIQKTCYLMRVCKRIRKDYDIIISADNETDFGCRGIQYFHYPYMHEKIRPSIDLPWYNKLVGVLNGSYRPWMLISRFSYNRMINNLTLVNSDWTGEKAKEFYGIDTITVYPPVPGNFPNIVWEEKENGFVCIGRFHPVKRFEEIIHILTRIKTKFPEIHLHIIGTRDKSPEAHDYYEQLKLLVRVNSSWIYLHENLSREELLELILKHRYGIHAHQKEHFGIAVAEMIRAGCIPFVPNSGGQVEIVGGDERLIYGTEDEAIKKIICVMTNSEEQTSICSYLNSRKKLFSTERFMSQIREIVRQFQGTVPEGQRISAR
jgi:glycosyltransferase involved in cell wall biosynthesis